MLGSLRRHRWLVAGALLLLLATPSAAVHADGDRPGSSYVPNEVLVKLSPSADVRAIMAAYHLRAPITADAQLDQQPIYHLRIGDSTSPLRKADQLLHDRRVVYAEPNYVGALPETRQRGSWVVGEGAGDYAEQWAPDALRLPEAHRVTRGAGITVAILDTGADLAHPALEGRLLPGYDFVDADADPSEVPAADGAGAYGHGTHVAGLVALAAPEAMILPLRTINSNGLGTIWAQAQALRYARNHGADVINLSYSFGRPSRLLDDILAQVTCTVAVDVSCRSRVHAGALVVAAAGNSGTNIREYPAADLVPGLLAVGASTEADTLAWFSTYGSWVPLAAPGDLIVSSVPGGGYAAWSGTSMATPLAAGVAALVRSANPSLRPLEVQSRLTVTSSALSGAIRRQVDAAAALGVAPAPRDR